MILPEKATSPTLYFIGVTTTQSSIMKLFPLWAEALHLDGALIKGIDIPLNASPQTYRDVVDFIQNDPLSMGALVTTHKVNLYNAAADMFDTLDLYAMLFKEMSCISKNGNKLCGHAKDAISSGLSLDAFVPHKYWETHKGEALLLGSGGSSIAIGSYLLNPARGADIPTKLTVTARRQEKLDEIKHVLTQVNPNAHVCYCIAPSALAHDDILSKLPPYSLVVNATGMGKDTPGSPLTDGCAFPANSLVWELNYRGELDFMHQALAQKEAKNLHVEDGWVYFIHGWTQVVSEVFHFKMTDDIFETCSELGQRIR